MYHRCQEGVEEAVSAIILVGERAYELHDYPTAETTPENTVAPEPVYRDWPRVASPSYSIQVFMWWRIDIAARDLDLVNDMGFGWVKQRFAWRDIEDIQPGSYNWHNADEIVSLVEAKGLRLVAQYQLEPTRLKSLLLQGPRSLCPDNIA